MRLQRLTILHGCPDHPNGFCFVNFRTIMRSFACMSLKSHTIRQFSKLLRQQADCTVFVSAARSLAGSWQEVPAGFQPLKPLFAACRLAVQCGRQSVQSSSHIAVGLTKLGPMRTRSSSSQIMNCKENWHKAEIAGTQGSISDSGSKQGWKVNSGCFQAV